LPAHRRSAFALEVAGLHLTAMLVIRVTVPAADEEAQALREMVLRYSGLQQTNEPIHTWPTG